MLADSRLFQHARVGRGGQGIILIIGIGRDGRTLELRCMNRLAPDKDRSLDAR